MLKLVRGKATTNTTDIVSNSMHRIYSHKSFILSKSSLMSSSNPSSSLASSSLSYYSSSSLRFYYTCNSNNFNNLNRFSGSNGSNRYCRYGYRGFNEFNGYNGHNGYYYGHIRWLMKVLIAVGISGLITGIMHGINSNDNSNDGMNGYYALCNVALCEGNDKHRNKPLTLQDFSKALRPVIEKIRKKHNNNKDNKQNKRPTPVLTTATVGNTHELSLTTSLDIDSISLMLFWSQILGPDVDVNSKVDGNIREHTLVAGDKRSSMILKQGSSGITATLYKDDGFSLNDIDYIAKGYEQSLAGIGTGDRSGSISNPGGERQGGLGSGMMMDPFFFSFFSPDGEIGPGMDFNGASIRGGGRGSIDDDHMQFRRHGGLGQDRRGASDDPIEHLRGLGVEVFHRNDTGNKVSSTDNGGNTESVIDEALDWDALAGYPSIKEQMEETVILSVLHPDVYDSIAKQTRVRFESNRPKAVLLEGPPGTGKTLTARILARKCDRPLVHLRLESVVNKWYGESEKKLGKIFDLCDQLEGAIIFIDEVDSLAGSRDNGEMHEATRRLLSVVLQRTEGFHGKGKSLLLCATNRKQDLDAALLSRFDLQLKYDLPDFAARSAVLARYARQFAKQPAQLEQLATASDGLSCRDLKEACEHAERKWAARLIRGETKLGLVPSIDVYLQCLQQRTAAVSHSADARGFAA